MNLKKLKKSIERRLIHIVVDHLIVITKRLKTRVAIIMIRLLVMQYLRKALIKLSLFKMKVMEIFHMTL